MSGGVGAAVCSLAVYFFVSTFNIVLISDITSFILLSGVYGLYFDKDGNLYDYKPLLTGTSR